MQVKVDSTRMILWNLSVIPPILVRILHLWLCCLACLFSQCVSCDAEPPRKMSHCIVCSWMHVCVSLQLTACRAPSSHGVYSRSVASYTEGLLVEHSSLLALPLYSWLRRVCCIAAMTAEADHGGNMLTIDSRGFISRMCVSCLVFPSLPCLKKSVPFRQR